MRRVAFAVPEPVLTAHARLTLAQETAALGGLWLSAAAASDQLGVLGLPQPLGGQKAASRTEAHQPPVSALPLNVPKGAKLLPAVASMGARLGRGPGGRGLLCLTPGVNGGFVSDGPVACAKTFSAAVIWAPGETPAKTLFALRGAARAQNYLFLSEEAPGELVLRDNDNILRLEARLQPGLDWALAVISISEGQVGSAEARIAGEAPAPEQVLGTGLAGTARVGLAVTGVAGTASAALERAAAGRAALEPRARFVAEAMGLPNELRVFVGCRAAREGMAKSLGAARISDLFYWPGIDLLAEPPGQTPLARAFDDFCLWEL